jgi:hypothetical protein
MSMAADAVIFNLNQRRASGPADLIEHFAVETDTHAAMMHCRRRNDHDRHQRRE